MARGLHLPASRVSEILLGATHGLPLRSRRYTVNRRGASCATSLVNSGRRRPIGLDLARFKRCGGATGSGVWPFWQAAVRCCRARSEAPNPRLTFLDKPEALLRA